MAEIKTIAVIGAGIMGRGIAHVAALGGYRTILEDLIPAALRKAESAHFRTEPRQAGSVPPRSPIGDKLGEPLLTNSPRLIQLFRRLA